MQNPETPLTRGDIEQTMFMGDPFTPRILGVMTREELLEVIVFLLNERREDQVRRGLRLNRRPPRAG